MICKTIKLDRWSKLSKRYYLAFLTGLLPMAIIMSIHFYVSVFRLIAITIVLGGLSMFSIILSDQIRQYMRQQSDIAHQHANIMVLQMRPHFIYNTMMSIYYLCKAFAKDLKTIYNASTEEEGRKALEIPS